MRAAAIILLMATGCAAARELRQMPPWVTAGGGGDAPSGVMPPWATAAAPGAAPGAVNGSCPPPGFDAVDNLDVESYISAPWYVLSQVRSNAACMSAPPPCRPAAHHTPALHPPRLPLVHSLTTAQVPLIYQPKDQLFCTQARYEALGPDVVKGAPRLARLGRARLPLCPLAPARLVCCTAACHGLTSSLGPRSQAAPASLPLSSHRRHPRSQLCAHRRRRRPLLQHRLGLCGGEPARHRARPRHALQAGGRLRPARRQQPAGHAVRRGYAWLGFPLPL